MRTYRHYIGTVPKTTCMNGFAKFRETMLDIFGRHIAPTSKKETRAIGKVTQNFLLDLEGPKHLTRNLTGRETYRGKTFRGFAEIFVSMERLEDIAFLVGRFPFQNTRISREQYLQLLVECYFSEVYVLQERLVRYVLFLERQYKRDGRFSSIRDEFKHFPSLIKIYLKPLVSVRDTHVHEARLSETSIRRLEALGLIARYSKNATASLLSPLYRQDCIKTKNRWKAKIKADAVTIRSFLDFYFEKLHPVVFNHKSGDFNYPSNLKF